MTSTRLFVAALLLALSTSLANAYTIVMRDGRRFEIPNQFTVTQSTLTYEVGSGIQVTVQLAGVDITATEQANGEALGSFFSRTSAPAKAADPALQRRRPANRSITNKDLENYRQTRIQSELAYEKRKKELGLPAREIEERTREELASMRSREDEAEKYWRGRASSLRTEIATNQAQIDFVRSRLDEIPSTNSFGAFATQSPFGTFGSPVLGFPFQNVLTRGFRTSLSPFTNNWNRFNRFNGRGRFYPFGGDLLAMPYETSENSYERMELVNQLNQLQMNRAALNVRWRELEEEARRAGAYPGWLRPE